MSRLTMRDANESDLSFIVDLIDSDTIAAKRDPARQDDAREQREAFSAIQRDPNHRLIVAELNGEPIGSFQLSFVPGVSRQGAWRGQIESVRIHPRYQGKGLGSEMIEWAIEECRRRGCGLVQLTSDRQRDDAHRFYERLKFKPTHTGFKLKLR